MNFNKILILFLLVSTIGFGLTWYFGGYDVSKQKVKELEEQYKKLEEEKKAADAKIATWKEVFKEVDKRDKRIAIEIGQAKATAAFAKENAEKSKRELNNLQSGMKKTLDEIEDMKKNPKVLTDEELLEDLIKNTK